ncbi:hypothetical protein OVN18_01435 [Microcella daejeonensis]|uniref:Uncharacterized protein n=1 Tax=Microcella daejeonensis TaxID=2994971 RepID=A0A9E8S8K5_9MICO|nr:hypothetical protein [Microcella daejeonensis]WAB81710.1 hypothetical protein OVN18_01435 [Microcella daejeonensis]
MTPLKVEYCGEWFDVADEFFIGREADLSIDENPYLHRRFLSLRHEFDLWWLHNVGQLLTATVSDAAGSVQAWLSPGAKLPIVFPELQVVFTAGSTTYDFAIHSEGDHFRTSPLGGSTAGSTTIAPITFTRTQRMLILALCEPFLLQARRGRAELPSSAQAAERLGWPTTTFNRKLDNVCEKLDRIGVDGLRGGAGKLATNRRARLVEYAIATHLVGLDDLPLLDDAGAEVGSEPSAR